MRQKSMPVREPAERVVKDIRRATRRHFLAEDKIRVVLDGLRGEVSTPEQMYGPPPVGKHFRSMAGRGLLQCIRPFGGAICSWPRWVFARPGPHKMHGHLRPFAPSGFQNAGSTVRPSVLSRSQTWVVFGSSSSFCRHTACA